MPEKVRTADLSEQWAEFMSVYVIIELTYGVPIGSNSISLGWEWILWLNISRVGKGGAWEL